MQCKYSPAQIHVGEGKDTQVQGGAGRKDVSEKTGERGLYAMRQGAETGTERTENKRKVFTLYPSSTALT